MAAGGAVSGPGGRPFFIDFQPRAVIVIIMRTHPGGHRRRLLACCAALIAASAMSACSLNRTAVKLVADALASGAAGSSFSSDDDPELVGDAVPFALKLYESLLDTVTDNPKPHLAAGSGYVMYANAWVADPR